MPRDMENFNRSVRKLRKEIAESQGYDPNDPNFKEPFDELVKKMTNDRIGKYSKRVLQKYPLSLVSKVFSWATNNVSSAEFEDTPFEVLMANYMIENPNSVSSKEVGNIFDPKTGKLKPFVRDPYSDDIRWPDVQKAQEGIIEELPPPPKVKPQAPAMPSQEQLKTMDSETIGKIIKQAKAAGVKE